MEFEVENDEPTAARSLVPENLGMLKVLIAHPQFTKPTIRYGTGRRDEAVLNLNKVDNEFFEMGA